MLMRSSGFLCRLCEHSGKQHTIFSQLMTKIQFEYGSGDKQRTIGGNILAICFDKNSCFWKAAQLLGVIVAIIELQSLELWSVPNNHRCHITAKSDKQMSYVNKAAAQSSKHKLKERAYKAKACNTLL